MTMRDAPDAPDDGSESKPLRQRLLRALHPRNRRRAGKAVGGRNEKLLGPSSPTRPASSTGIEGNSEVSLPPTQPHLTELTGTSGPSGESLIGPSATKVNPSLEIWSMAYERVREREIETVTIYERILSSCHTSNPASGDALSVGGSSSSASAGGEGLASGNVFANSNRVDRVAMMEDIATKALQRVQKHESAEEWTEVATNWVIGLKDFVGALLTSYPPAAIAWSGITVALPFLVKILQMNRQLAAALKYMMQRSSFFLSLCPVLFGDQWKQDPKMEGFKLEVKDSVMALFEMILWFKIRCVCRCFLDRRALANIKDALLDVSWEKEEQSVKAQEQLVNSGIDKFNQSSMIGELRSIDLDFKELVPVGTGIQAGIQSINELLEAQNRKTSQRPISDLIGRFKTTPYLSFMEANPRHVEGTCKWFSDHPKFRDWLLGRSRQALLVSAAPGCGKSVLAKHLVTNVIPQALPSSTVCYFFFKDNAEQSRLSNAYSAMLHRLFQQNPSIVDHYEADIRTSGKTLVENPYDLWDIFTKAVKSHRNGPVICVLDALDECQPNSLDVLARHLSSEEIANRDVRFLLTTRGLPSILEILQLPHRSLVHLAGENEEEVARIQDEITLVVDHRLEVLAGRRGKDLHSDEMTILARALRRRGSDQRTYLWVTLIFEVLEKSRPSTYGEWEAMVNTLPKNASRAYAKLLQNVKPDVQEMVLTILQLVLVAYRPLTLHELNIALNAIRPPSPDSLPIQEERMVNDRDFRNMMMQNCGYFVTEYGGKVYFIHQTAKEFLLETGHRGKDQQEPNRPLWTSGISSAAAHAAMAERCITFLSSPTCVDAEGIWNSLIDATIPHSFRDASRKLVQLHPFAEYVARFWPSHLRHSQLPFESSLPSGMCSTRSQRLYKTLLLDSWSMRHPALLVTLRMQRLDMLLHDSTTELRNRFRVSEDNVEVPKLVAQLGLMRPPGAELQTAVSFDAAGLAAFWGHLEMLREFSWPAEVSARCHASENVWLKRAGISRWIDASPTIPAAFSWSQGPVICAAAAGGSIPCLNYLLEKDISIHSSPADGGSPLHWAAKLGHDHMVEYLLARGADPDIKESQGLGRTPLDHVLYGSSRLPYREKIARRLVDASCNPDLDKILLGAITTDWGLEQSRSDGSKPRYAQILGREFDEEYHDSFIKWLVDRGADVDAENGRPLRLACGTKSLYGVMCLLRSGARADSFPPEEPHSRWYSPLHAACVSAGSTDVHIVSALLQHGADPNLKDSDGQRPLELVRHLGWNRDMITSALLARGASQDMRNEMQRTLLHEACYPTDTFRMRRLLEHGADVTAVDSDGNTPLHLVFAKPPHGPRGIPWEVGPWVEKAVMMLVSKGASTEVRNKQGKTPLQIDSARSKTWIMENQSQAHAAGVDAEFWDALWSSWRSAQKDMSSSDSDEVAVGPARDTLLSAVGADSLSEAGEEVPRRTSSVTSHGAHRRPVLAINSEPST